MVIMMIPSGTPKNSFNHSSFRDDATIQYVVEWLANHRAGIMSILDCGCQDARLAKMLMAAGVKLERIRYDAFDMADASVQAVRAEQDRSAFKDFADFKIVLREIIDMDGFKPGSFHLIVVNNLLHEVKPEYIPRVLQKFNELLARPGGRLAMIDMEELPPEEFEPTAITFRVHEVEKIFLAGGFRPHSSSHKKRVQVYRVWTEPIPHVETKGIAQTLLKILKEKKEQLRDKAAECCGGRYSSKDAQRELCKLAAVVLAIHQLER